MTFFTLSLDSRSEGPAEGRLENRQEWKGWGMGPTRRLCSQHEADAYSTSSLCQMCVVSAREFRPLDLDLKSDHFSLVCFEGRADGICWWVEHGYERKRSVEGGFRVFGLSHRVNAGGTGAGRTRRSRLEEVERQEFSSRVFKDSIIFIYRFLGGQRRNTC